MRLSVIIVNYNVRYFLEQCLLSVQKALTGIDAEVFVVDNNSVDGSVAMVADKFPWVTLLANKENTGFSRANNQAMREAKGEYILLLNPDTVVQEDTFRSVIAFMDEHPDAGGLGVKMVDGKGNFLPESKRGLPTPEVAFYKIFGLSRIFPKSKRFAQYHLGHLDTESTHEVEILSGAFMLMRKKALDQVGLLDEDFFMYGEDIDLSWRIIQGGWKNYYYPGTRIIHYKGESTKKGSLNYVYVFYNAMVIFARKHFSQRHAKWFSFFIHLAIWMRAGVAVLNRFIRTIRLPLLDAITTIGAMWGLKNVYSQSRHIPYDNVLVLWSFLACALVWLIAGLLGGAYDRPLRPLKVIRPILIGALFILIVYSLLPEDMRFSRALILAGTFVSILFFFLNRVIINWITTGKTGISQRSIQNLAIVGYEEEVNRVRHILDQASAYPANVVKVSPGENLPEGYPGSIGQLDDIVRIHTIDQVIFCARDVPSSDIIGAMSTVNSRNTDFKIAPPESLYIIGSNSIETTGDVFMLEVNSVTSRPSKRSKRLLDISISLVGLTLFPIALIVMKSPLGFLRNIFRVLSGKASWVGYCQIPGEIRQAILPHLRPGVLDPLHHLPATLHTREHATKLNVVYAKDYHVRNDLLIIWRGLRDLGKSPESKQPVNRFPSPDHLN